MDELKKSICSNCKRCEHYNFEAEFKGGDTSLMHEFVDCTAKKYDGDKAPISACSKYRFKYVDKSNVLLSVVYYVLVVLVGLYIAKAGIV